MSALTNFVVHQLASTTDEASASPQTRKPLLPRPELGAKLSAEVLVEHAHRTFPDVMAKLAE